jgi:hypothetical protein
MRLLVLQDMEFKKCRDVPTYRSDLGRHFLPTSFSRFSRADIPMYSSMLCKNEIDLRDFSFTVNIQYVPYSTFNGPCLNGIEPI